MLIRELLHIIHQGLDSSDSINLDSPVAFTFGDPNKEKGLHLEEAGVAAATNMETGVREDIMYITFMPNEPDLKKAKALLVKLLGTESLKHMKPEGNA